MLRGLYINNETTFQKIMRQDAKNFMREVRDSNFRIDNETLTSKMIVPLEPDSPLATALRTRLKHFDNNRYSITTTVSLEAAVLKDTVVIEDAMELKDCMAIAKNLQEDKESRLYGVVLVEAGNTQNRINPLHPLVALELLEKNDGRKYRMIIYTLPSNFNDDNMYSDSERIDENIYTQVALFKDKKKVGMGETADRRTNDKLADFRMGHELVRESSTRIALEDSSSNHIDIMVPIQISVKGLSIPYYGTSLLRYTISNCNLSGSHVSPMNSSNIGETDASVWHSDTSSMRNSVCTGSFRNNTIKGWRGMGVSNRGNAYHSALLHKGWYTYVEKCINTSLELYNEKFRFVEPVVELTFKQQWLQDRQGSTEMDYIQFLAERLDNPAPAPSPIPEVNSANNTRAVARTIPQASDTASDANQSVPSIDDVTAAQ